MPLAAPRVTLAFQTVKDHHAGHRSVSAGRRRVGALPWPSRPSRRSSGRVAARPRSKPPAAAPAPQTKPPVAAAKPPAPPAPPAATALTASASTAQAGGHDTGTGGAGRGHGPPPSLPMAALQVADLARRGRGRLPAVQRDSRTTARSRASTSTSRTRSAPRSGPSASSSRTTSTASRTTWWSGRVDMIVASLSMTDERRARYDFTERATTRCRPSSWRRSAGPRRPASTMSPSRG